MRVTFDTTALDNFNDFSGTKDNLRKVFNITSSFFNYRLKVIPHTSLGISVPEKCVDVSTTLADQ
jgi:hypothetical protein